MFKKGDVVNRWHDAGCMGMQMVFGEVIRVNRKTVTVRWERNRVWRIEPQHIELVTGNFAEEVRAEYLSEPSNTASTRQGAGVANEDQNPVTPCG